MASSPNLRSLRGFNPETDLTVDESFHRLVSAWDDLACGDTDRNSVPLQGREPGRGCGTIHTGGAIHSGFAEIEMKSGRVVFASTNLKGELYFFESSGEGLKVSGKIKLQGSLYSPPVYNDGIIYCVAREGAVFAVDTGLKDIQTEPELLSGRVIWQKKTKKGIFTEPVAAGKVLLVTPLDGVYAYGAFNGHDRRIGEVLWGLPLNGTVSTPVLNSGGIFIGTEEKKLLAFNYGSEKIRKIWEYDLSGACRAKVFVSERNNQAVAGTIDGFVYSVDSGMGTYKWNFTVKAPVLSPVVAGDSGGEERIYFGADNGIFYSIDSGGRKVWEFRAGGKIRTEALVHGGRVYFGAEDNTFYSLDLASGRPVFTFRADGSIYGKPVIHDRRVFFGATDGSIHALYI